MKPLVSAVAMALSLLALACGGLEGEPGPAGPAGPPRAQGPAGPQGPAGEAGDDGVGLLKKTTCTVTSSILGQTVFLDAVRYDFADGSVTTACSAQDASRMYSTTNVFKSSQNGAVLGLCAIGYDLDGASGGFWEFSLPQASPNTGTVKYVGAGSGASGRAFTMTCNTY